ncbi:MAG: PQQ-binding-like beta-propeller repeat protein, partial [Bacteroidota bacterium]
MKRLACAFALWLGCMSMATAQKKIYPTKEKTKLILLFKDYAKKPIKKAPFTLTAANGNETYQGKTNKNGFVELLVRNGRTYHISVGDSLKHDFVHIPRKPMQITRHIVYFEGMLNGKMISSGKPMFRMMGPKDGLASVDVTFENPKGAPLPGEKVWLRGSLDTARVFTATTNAKGKLVFEVPIGETYHLSVRHHQGMDRFNFAKRGGSYNVRVRYRYAGAVAIERARAARRAADSLAAAYAAQQDSLLNDPAYKAFVDSLKAAQTAQGHRLRYPTRTTRYHKRAFRPIAIAETAERPVRERTDEGFSFNMEHSGKVLTPTWMDGNVYFGEGYSRNVLYCAEGITGNVLWGVEMGENGISTLSAGAGSIALITESCTIYVLDGKTGKLRWSKWLNSSLRSAPTLYGDRVFQVYEDAEGGRIAGKKAPGSHVLACFDVMTGEVIWQQWIEEEVISAPVAYDGKLYCATYSGMLMEVDTAAGNILQTRRHYLTSAPTPVDNVLYASMRDMTSSEGREQIVALNRRDFSLKRGFGYHAAPYLESDMQRKGAYLRERIQEDVSVGLEAPAINAAGRRACVNSEKLVGMLGSSALLSFSGSRPVY